MNVGDTIIVKAYNNFPEFRMKCIGLYGDTELGAIGYEFDNGMKLLDIELENNFALWNSRNGYEIQKGI